MPKLHPFVYEERRRHILAVSRQVFAQKGFQASTIKDITQAAGISNGALFIYFKTKRDILLAVMAENLGAVAERIEAIVAASDTHSLEESLVLLLELVRQIAMGQGRAVVLHAWSEAMVDPVVKQAVDGHYSGILGSLEQLVRKARTRGQLPERPSPRRIAQALFSVFIPGYIIQMLMVSPMEPQAYLNAHRDLWAEPARA